MTISCDPARQRRLLHQPSPRPKQAKAQTSLSCAAAAEPEDALAGQLLDYRASPLQGSCSIQYPQPLTASTPRIPVNAQARQKSGSDRCDVRFCDCERLLWSNSDVADGSIAPVRETSAHGPQPATRLDSVDLRIPDVRTRRSVTQSDPAPFNSETSIPARWLGSAAPCGGDRGVARSSRALTPGHRVAERFPAS